MALSDNSVETEQWKSRQDCLLISQRIDQSHDSKTTDHCTFASRACVQIINQSHSRIWAVTGIVQGMFLHINTHSKVSPPCLTTGQDTAIGPTPSLPAGILLRTQIVIQANLLLSLLSLSLSCKVNLWHLSPPGLSTL